MADKETVVITGGAGFVGRHLIDELLREWTAAQLIVLDRKIDNLPEGVLGFEADLTKPTSCIDVLEKYKPKWVVHLAAIAPVPAAMKDPETTFLVNTEATVWLLEAVKEHSGGTRVLAVSSSDIYGIESSTPLPELSLEQAQPRNPYAESKLAMERAIEEKFNDFVLRVRPFPHIGPGQGRGFVTADFASQIAAAERGEQEPVIRVGNLETKRDFTDVRDVVRAYRLLMKKGMVGDVYHVASGRAILISDLLDRLVGLAKCEVKVFKDEKLTRKSDVMAVHGSAEKLSQLTGWQPEISLDESLADILDYWR